MLLTVADVRTYLTLFYVLNININLAAAFIKLSLLFQYLRLFKKESWAYRASIVGIVFVSLWGLVFVLLALFPCSNIPDAWNIFAQNAHCWGYGSQNPDLFTLTFVTHNVINTVFDIYITALPFQLYFQPGVTIRSRLGLMVLLLMGATCVLLVPLLWIFIKILTRPETASSRSPCGASTRPYSTRRAGCRHTTRRGTAR